MESATDWAFGANEDSIVVVYGARDRVGGYVVGRRTLKLEEGPRGVRKVRDGMYLFQE